MKDIYPIYNQRFAVKPREEDNLHRPVSEDIGLEKILCIKEARTLRNDFTISYNTKPYQIEEKVITKKVTIEERLDGSLAITHRGRDLKFKQITDRPLKQKEEEKRIIKSKTKYIPPADHPWRKFRTTKHYENKKPLHLTNT